MERRLVVRGILAGAVAGLLAFVFARIFAEPQIARAIDYESARDAAQAALDTAAGKAVADEGPDIFSRTIQANVGIGVGLVLFGAAMGAAFSFVYTLSLGRVGRVRPRQLSLLVAGAGFLAVFLVPFLKYPANPPAIGHPDTIKQRGELFLVMVVGSIAFLTVAVVVGRRLASRLGTWNATLVAGAGFAVVMGVLMAVLPPLGHLADNVAQYGKQPTETPLPLTDPQGNIVFPGFPADVLATFRFYSVCAQVLLWGTIGVVFGPLAERVLAPAMTAPAARVPVAA